MDTIHQLLCARWVLPIAPENSVLENHAVAVNNGKIVAVLPTEQALGQFSAKETIHLGDHALLPGFVNAHAHNPMVLFRGLADDLPLMDWLNNHIWPAEQALIKPESIIDGSRLAIAEMIRSGTTCFSEHYFFPEETAQVVAEEGIRAAIGLHVMEVPTLWAQGEEDSINKAIAIYNNRTENPLISWTLAPHSPYTNSHQGLTRLRELSDEWGLPIHIHLHESQDELQINQEKHGERPIASFEKLGLLNSKLIAVHMVHLNEDEIALLAEKGVNVVHCPESNLKLASGFPNMAKLQQAGINVAIGTDGAASNNDLDMIGEMRTAAFIGKSTAKDPTALPAHEILKMSTLNGAKALGLDDKIGSIEAGKEADLIAINLNDASTQPVYNPASTIVYSACRSQVSDVWVAGKALLRSGAYTQLDLKKTLSRANHWRDQAKQFGRK